ncbi:MAG: hypothetical protein JWN59_476 [Sphingomonas bacterium]|jgi:hypothetical protein|nr:hypothetical protein [Sphingomonas bacterium]MDB5684175.1 hypothetical protein [Sphingomonas bacterium]
MAIVDGDWDCVTRTPMGDQKAVLSVRSAGNSFTGSMSSPMGSLDVIDGTVEGNTIIWKMDMKAPFPMLLACQATIDGDSIEGGVTAGAFGTSPLSGTRKA